MTITPEFWRGRSVLLTGHTGFKGGWLSLWLQQLGAEVHGLALAPPSTPNLFDAAQVGQFMASSTFADIRDSAAVLSVFKKTRPEIVIHMAAQALVRESYSAPLDTYAVNVMGTANILDAVRATAEAKAAIIVTSDKCYENREWNWGYREVDNLGGYDPYSSSKACAELVAAAYRTSYFSPARYFEHGMAVATARAGNVIGGGDWASDRLIPDLLYALERGKPVSIRNPQSVRPWQHVLEPLSGYLSLAEKLASSRGVTYGDAWNFGPADDDARPVQWIVEQMIELWGNNAGWVIDEQLQPHEARYLKLDCSKAQTNLGWKPRWKLARALSAIIDWQRAYTAGADMRARTLAQIHDFEGLPV
ncbi:MAG: CDP-glucose 4,6-dehydratase [Glaciimonas sp.]|nr:CDP-glucose 4,6-dehydratase [Glaciimonas sp.]